MGTLILFGGMLGALIGVFGRRSVGARRTGAVLIGLDVLRRVVDYLMFRAAGAPAGTPMEAALARQVHASVLFWAPMQILLIVYFLRKPK